MECVFYPELMSNTRRTSGASASTQRSTSSASTAVVVAVVAALCIGAVTYLGLRGDSSSTMAAATQPGAVSCSQPPPTPAQASSYPSAPDPSLADDAAWTATLTTNCGVITLELYGDKAPQTVASFVFLAEHGYWSDSPCHRLTTAGIFVLQCGDPTGSGTGSPGYGFGIENAPADGKYPSGTVAMARSSDPNSNGGQFFLVYRDTTLPTDGGGYSIFGRVIGGMEIVQHIADQGVARGGGDGSPAQPISLLSVSVHQP